MRARLTNKNLIKITKLFSKKKTWTRDELFEAFYGEPFLTKSKSKFYENKIRMQYLKGMMKKIRLIDADHFFIIPSMDGKRSVKYSILVSNSDGKEFIAWMDRIISGIGKLKDKTRHQMRGLKS